MTRILQIRLVLAVIGVVVWGYAVSVDDARLRVVGMVVLAASLILRFLPRLLDRDKDNVT